MPNQSNISQKEIDAYKYIRNQLVHFNHAPSVREVMRHLEMNAPRSAEIVINKLIDKGLLKRRADNNRLQVVSSNILPSNEGIETIDLPLVGRVAAGMPILAEENIETYISVDKRILKGNTKGYYLLRVHGNSMNRKNIHNGDIVIVKIQSSADKGQIIVALINDEATIKEFIPFEDKVFLKPHSTDKSIQPIILHEDFLIRGIVVGTIPGSYL